MAISLISLDEIRLLGRGSRVMTSYLSSLNLNQQKRRFLLVDFPTLHFFWVPFVYSKVLQFCFFFLFLYYPISFDCHRLRQPNFRRQFLARQRRMGRRPRRSPPELFRIFRSFFSFGFVSFFIVRSFVGRSLSSPFFFTSDLHQCHRS